MILIADSGATKTDWLLNHQSQNAIVKTEGINPFHQSDEKIGTILKEELLPKLYTAASKILHDSNEIAPLPPVKIEEQIHAVHFYGAGCLSTHINGISHELHALFPKAQIEIQTDLLGAARALCGHDAGIACILGTGANSCLYDGKQIQKNIPPLGYILGDEGSGAYLGKRFVSDCFKGQLPSFLRDGLMDEFKLTYTDIINNVYKEPQANRFLASLTPYIYKVRAIPEVHGFLIDCFETFFRRNVIPYHAELPLSFTGSISWYFQEEIKEAAINLGLTANTFLKNPIEGMASFHHIPITNK